LNALTIAGQRWLTGLFLVCGLVLMYGIFRPAPPPELFEQSDKFLHLLAFVALTLSGRAALSKVPALPFWSLFLMLGPALEVAQHWFQPGRVFSVEDAIANIAGSLLAAAFWCLWRRWRTATA
jgi:VanZ family protein